MTRTNELASAKACLTELHRSAETASLLAAVSGGLDSMCLLHLLSTWGQAQGFTVTAAHFNHQLRGAESERDERFVQSWCQAHGIPFVSGRGDVRALARGLSLEEAARNARYAFLTEQKNRLGCGWIVTAHHADDNAETMLLNLLRGTGLRGLCGIPKYRDGIARPFLQVTREELAAYAAANGLPYVEDSTNALEDAARNVLRHQVLPVLKALNPKAVENMSRTAGLLSVDEAALKAAAETLLSHAEIRPGNSAKLPISPLQAAPEAVQSRVILSALSAVSGHEQDLTAAHVRSVRNLRQGQLSMPYEMTVRREKDALYVEKSVNVPPEQTIAPGGTVHFGSWQVTLAAKQPLFPPDTVLTVSGWRPKDRLHGRTLKRLWADRGVTAAERETLPVLRADGRAVAAAYVEPNEFFTPEGYESPAWVIFKNETEENANEQ